MISKDGIILDRREMLKVKVKTLMAEAHIIRNTERRYVGQRMDGLRGELHHHRVTHLRWEARDTHLAYGFIRGRTLEQMEPKSDPDSGPGWKNVRKMIEKYGPVNITERTELLKRVPEAK